MRCCRVLAATIACLCAGTAVGALVPIYAGPAYDSTSVNGYKNPQSAISPIIPAVNDFGTAIGVADHYLSGTYTGFRAVGWDSTGAIELANLGTDSVGTTFSGAAAINSTGTTVGSASKYVGGKNFGYRAVRWDSWVASATELGDLGVSSAGYAASQATAINAGGTIIGVSDKFSDSGTDLGSRAVRWQPSGTTPVELGNLGTDPTGTTTVSAIALNASGTSIGDASKYTGSGTYLGARAVRWNPSGTAATELGNIGTNTAGVAIDYAYAINTAGTTVGIAEKYDGSGTSIGFRAVRWDASGTVATELGNLSVNPNGVANDQATAINMAGTAVGSADKYTSAGYAGIRAVRWDAAGTAITELANLGTDSSGNAMSRATAINDAGIAVGNAQEFDASHNLTGQRAVCWNPDGTVVDLNSLIAPNSGWTLTDALSISNTGWIAGVGTFDPGGGQMPYTRYFTLQLPEPASTSLVVVGGLLLLRRRRT